MCYTKNFFYYSLSIKRAQILTIAVESDKFNKGYDISILY